MKKMYKILENKKKENLEYQVNCFLSTGWKLVGSVQYAKGKYMQAMTTR